VLESVATLGRLRPQRDVGDEEEQHGEHEAGAQREVERDAGAGGDRQQAQQQRHREAEECTQHLLGHVLLHRPAHEPEVGLHRLHVEAQVPHLAGDGHPHRAAQQVGHPLALDVRGQAGQRVAALQPVDGRLQRRRGREQQAPRRQQPRSEDGPQHDGQDHG
jgi:hypothetical protein